VSAQVSFYLRDDRVFVVPQAGGGGFTFDVEPVMIVAPTDEEVHYAARQALAASAAVQGDTPPEGRYRSPVLKAARVRSFREFYQGSTYCFLYQEESHFFILAFGPARDGKGFDLSTEPPRQVKHASSIGAEVLECLRHSEQMPCASH
jgi:hypothetical protein